jgi:hypothetical protein
MHHLNELLDPRIRKQDIEKNYENVKTNHSMRARANDWNKTMFEILERNN